MQIPGLDPGLLNQNCKHGPRGIGILNKLSLWLLSPSKFENPAKTPNQDQAQAVLNFLALKENKLSQQKREHGSFVGFLKTRELYVHEL